MYEAKNRDCNLWRFRHVIAFLLILSAVSLNALGANGSDSNDLFNLSLEQLMNIDVYAPATLTEKDPLKTPACVTIITAEDIAITPVRNILDLIEIYVPGALYLNHAGGPTLGMRGIITERPYKYLVNVNGLNVNIKTRYGARLELMNWELSDIDRIEIIRGPGSVTYGPGAIGGVINIYTKRAKQAQGLQFGGTYWSKYNSNSNWFSYGRVKDDFELYTYFSMVTTEGISPDLFSVERNKYSTGKSPNKVNHYAYKHGYLGKGSSYSPSPPGTYMGNYYDEPEIKAHLDIKFNDNWRFWARYATASESVTQFNSVQYLINGTYRDLRQARFRYFILALENQNPLNKDWDLKSTFGVSSTDVRDIQKYSSSNTTGTGNNSSKDNLQNYGRLFSEWKYYAQFMLNYNPDDSRLKGALGFEISYDAVRPGWGKNKDNGLRIADAIMSGPSSDAYGTGYNQYTEASTDVSYYAVGNGWETISHAFIGELNYQLSPKTTMILSARMDKHPYSTYLFSPRIALIYELKKDHYLKFIAQKSVRMNSQEELYTNHEDRKVNKPETLETFELIYAGQMTKQLSLETSVFFNRNEAIAWDSTQRSAGSVGTLKTLGWEIALKYEKENFVFGINHSIVKQLSWKTAGGIEASGISYSDYYQEVDDDDTIDGSKDITIGSHGNDLSNWANQATKLYTNIYLFKKKITLHGDIAAFWGFEGYEDGLKALSDAGGNAAQITAIREKDAFGILVKGNASLTWHVNKSADLSVFVQNIPIFGDNKRYQYNSGYDNNYPDKTSWVEEPMVVGFRYHIRF